MDQLSEEEIRRTIEVTGLPENVDPDIYAFFENVRWGGGEIAGLQPQSTTDSSTFITFKDETVAAKFLERGSVTIAGKIYEITKPSPSGKTSAVQEVPNTIEVSGIPETTSEEFLRMYFENKTRSGGGDIKTMTFDKQEGVATITFCDPDAVLKILEKEEHKLGSEVLQVIALESLTPDLIDQVCAVRVSNIPSTISQYILEVHFESAKRSGGEEFDEFLFDKDGGWAVVVYKSPEVCRRVAGRSHQLESAQLVVEALKPVPPPPIVVGETDERKLLVGDLPPDFKDEDLKPFLEKTAGCQIIQFNRGPLPDLVLLDFESIPNYESLRRLVVSRPFRGQMIFVQKVKPSACVLVSSNKSFSDEMLSMHFENPKRNGGGEVKGIRREANGDVIIEFHDRKVIPTILTTKQIIENHPLKTELFHDCLTGSSGSTSRRQKVRFPEDVTVPLDKRVLKFISDSAKIKTRIESDMQALNCAIEWQKPEEGTIKLRCTLTPGAKDVVKLATKWEATCSEKLIGHLDKITVKDEKISAEIWEEYVKKAKSIKKSDVNVEMDQASCLLRVVGLDAAVGDYLKTTAEIRNGLIEELAKRKSKTFETLTSLKPKQLQFLKAMKFPNGDPTVSKDLEVNIDAHQVSFQGTRDEINQAKIRVYELINNVFTRTSNNFDVRKAKFLHKGQTIDYFKELFEKKNLKVFWSVIGQDVEVSGIADNEIIEVLSLLNSEIQCATITLDINQLILMKHEKWKGFKKSLEDRLRIIEVTEDVHASTVTVVSTRNFSDQIENEIRDFLKHHTILEQLIPMEEGKVAYIEKFFSQEIDDMQNQMSAEGVVIEVMQKKNSAGILVRGTKSGLEKAVKRLIEVQQPILCTTHESDLYGIPRYFSSHRGKESKEKIETKNKVIVQIAKQPKNSGASGANGGLQAGGGVAGPIEKSTVSQHGSVIKVVKGNVVECRVKALVIPIGGDLKHTDGAAKAVVEAGGQTIEDECQVHVKTSGKLLPGHIYASKPGSLSCACIIHVALPSWQNGTKKEVYCLEEGIWNALEKSEQKGWTSLAISGGTNYPPATTAKAIVDTVAEFLDENKNFKGEIQLIDSSDQVVNYFHEMLIAKFGKAAVKMGGTEQSIQLLASPVPVGTTSDQLSLIQTNYQPGKDAATLLTPAGVRVTLIQGSIAALQVDVIVNTASKELNLSQGAVSNSILQAAGPNLQVECKSKMPNGLSPGQILVTTGCSLECKNVYHGACEQWDGGKGKAEQVIRDSLKNAFKTGHQNQMTSIAIPALGTGNLGTPREIVSAIMYEEAKEFSKGNPATTLRDIRFVVFDKPTIDVFQQHVKKLCNPSAVAIDKTLKSKQKRQLQQEGAVSSTFVTPERAARSAQDEIKEADISLDIPMKTVKIKSLVMEIKQGDITQENTDAIVNSTNKDLNLSQGAVAKAILQAGGRSIADECRKLGRTDKNGIAFTGAGNLKCKCIIHLATPSKLYLGNDPEGKVWEERIFHCLKEAEHMKLTSVAFPLLGTGLRNNSGGEMAIHILNAVGEFAYVCKPKHLKNIRVTIFQTAMVDEVFTALHKRLSEKKNTKSIWGKLTGWLSSFVSSDSSGNNDDKDDFELIEDSKTSPLVDYKCIFRVYGLSQTVIDKVLMELESLVKEKEGVTDKVLDSPDQQEAIAKLTAEQIRLLEKDAASHQVKASVEKGRKLSRIRLQGDAKDITDVVFNVVKILKEVEVAELKRNEAERIAQLAHWEFKDVDSSYESYPTEINAIIEQAFKSKVGFAQWEENDGQFKIDFKTNIEENLKNQKKREIRRIGDVAEHFFTLGEVASGSSKSDGSRGDKVEKEVICPRTIIVHNISEGHMQNLGLSLENQRNGGGKLESVRRNPDGTISANFVDETVAAMFLERGLVKVAGKIYEVTKPSPSVGKGPGKTSKVQEVPNTIEVSGIPTMTSEEFLKMYFENMKRSGGGDIKTMTYNKQEGVATITFCDTSAAMKILEKEEHKIGTEVLQVTAVEILTPDLIDQVCAVRVSNIPPTISQDFLEVYFESAKRSGGEEFDEFLFDKDDGCAVVVYKSSEVCRRVAGRSHQLESAQLVVKALKPAPPPPIVVGETDERKLLVGDLPPDFKDEDLKLFLEKAAGCPITQFNRGPLPDLVLLDFKSVPNYASLRRLVVSRPFRGQMIFVQKVKPSACVLVHDSKSFSDEMLSLHFENPKRSGGREVKGMRRDPNGDVIIEFQDRKVIPTVLTTKQIIENHPLKTELFHDCLVGSGGSTSRRQKVRIPEDVTIPVDKRVLKFISDSAQVKTRIESDMQAINCVIQWQTPEEGTIKLCCTLTPGSKAVVKLAAKWEATCSERMIAYLDKIAVKDEKISAEIWEEYVKKTESIKKSDVSVEMDQASCLLRLVGLDSAVGDYLKAAIEIRNGLLEELAKRKSKTYEILTSLKPNQLQLLKALKFPEPAISKDLEVNIDDYQVSFQGARDEINQAKIRVYELVNKMSTRMASKFDARKAKFLQKGPVIDYFKELFEKKKLKVFWSVKGQDLEVSGIAEQEIIETLSLLDSEIQCATIKLDVNQLVLMKQEKWKGFKKDLEDRLRIIEVTEDVHASTVTVVSTSNFTDEIENEMRDFLKHHTILEQLIPMEKGKVAYVEQFFSQEIYVMQNQMSAEGVVIEVMQKKNSTGILVRGTTTGLEKAVKRLIEIQQPILSNSKECDLYGVPRYFSSHRGKESKEKIETKNKVIVQIAKQPKNSGSSGTNGGLQAGGGVAGPIEKSTVSLHGTMIKVVKGNVVECRVKALVIPIGEDLKHTDGAAKAVLETGGQTIEDECQTHVKTSGKLLSGQIFASKPGSLSCTGIIHVALPPWQTGTKNEVKCLEEGIWNALEKAEQKGWTSLAISGGTNYPPATTAKAIVDIVAEFLDERKNFNGEIRLIDSSDQVVNLFHEMLIGKFGKAAVKIGETEQSRQLLASPVAVGTTPDQLSLIYTNYQPGKDAATLLTPEGVQVTLIQGGIAAQQVDVIVNTTSQELNLSQGAVSNSILQAAGPNLQAECKKKMPNGLSPGQILITTGYNLKCKNVYHGACEQWDGGKGKAEQVIRNLLKNAFANGHQNQMTSIAIPALGTGNLGNPREIVSAIMYAEAEEFSKANPATTLKDIRFVVFDKSTIDVFQQHVNRLCYPSAVTIDKTLKIKMKRQLKHEGAGLSTSVTPEKTSRPAQDETEAAEAGSSGNNDAIDDFEMIEDPKTSPLVDYKCIFRVYGLSQTVIDKVLEKLESLVKEAVTDKVLDSPDQQEAIAKLTPEQIRQLERDAANHQVKATVEQGLKRNRIRLQGDAKDLTDVILNVVKILKEVEVAELKRNEAERIAQLAHWEFKDVDGSYESYPTEINAIIELAFKSKVGFAQWEENDGQFKIDFKAHTEENLKNQQKTEVRRIGDEEPKNWDPMNIGEGCKLVHVPVGSNEYDEVETRIKATCQKTCKEIIKIERVQNKSMFQQYAVNKLHMEASAAAGATTERILWHGTNEATVPQINTNGFNRSYCGKNATVYGKGVYFARDWPYSAHATYSPPNAQGFKFIYQARVLTGEFTLGTQDIIDAPLKPNETTKRYDSVVDNIQNPSIFVVFRDTQVYPEYLITFV